MIKVVRQCVIIRYIIDSHDLAVDAHAQCCIISHITCLYLGITDRQEVMAERRGDLKYDVGCCVLGIDYYLSGSAPRRYDEGEVAVFIASSLLQEDSFSGDVDKKEHF